MSKTTRSLLAFMAVLALGFASCAGTPTPTPTTPPTTPPTTTPGTPTGPASPTTTQTTTAPAAPAATTTTTVAQPTVSELEMNNLLARAEGLRADAKKFELDALLPEDFKAVDSAYTAVTGEYKAAIAGGFDGVKAYPSKAKLETSVADWESFNAKGMPLKAEAELDKTSSLKAKAMEADAAELAQERWAKAEAGLAQANAAADSKDFAAAIPAYQYSAAAYDVAAEKAQANALRGKIFKNGYAKYSDSFFKMGEDQYKAEEALWAKGSKADLVQGASILRSANAYYDFVASKGAEYKSFEGKDKALEAKAAALGVKADVNAPDEYAGASDILAEAVSNQEKGSYESAYLWYSDAAAAFGSAYDVSINQKAAAEDAIADADAAVQKSDAKASDADMGDNVYLVEAKARLEKSKAQYGDQSFKASSDNAAEALNYSTMSDNFVDSEKARLQKEAADKLQVEKSEAAPAMNEARKRIYWAEDANIKADYPKQFKEASAAMAGADLAYQNERYLPAKTLAGEVNTILSDDFKAKVAADRKAIADKAAAEKAAAEKAAAEKAAAEKAAAEQAAAEKAAAEKAAAQLAADRADAEPAMADARARMAWANSDNIAKEYPKQYKDAKSSLDGAEIAYKNEKYVPAKALAQDTSSILSDDFKAKVADDRQAAAEKAAAEKAAAQLAADRADAEPAMADARARMAWANSDNIAKEYPKQYKDAKSSLDGAEIAYKNEKYVPAKALAQDTSSILSDDFKAKVAADRKAIADKAAAEKAAAEKAAADKAAADKAAADKAAADKAAAERLAAEQQAALDKAAAEKAAAEQAAAEKAAAEKAAAQLAADRADAEPAMADARARMAWANSDNIAKEYPKQYKDAKSSLDGAEIAYKNEKYVPAKALAQDTSSILSDDFKAKVAADRKAAADKAAAEKAAAEKAAADKAAADKAAADKLAAEQKAALEKAAAEKAAAEEAAKQAAIAQAKAQAQADIDKAQAKLDWANSKNGRNNFPAKWFEGAGLLDAAKFAFDRKAYQEAQAKAQASYAALSAIGEFAPLPGKYVVRLIPERRDCLWRIAEYPFVYNNPLKWPVLYEANKKTFKDPSNPNLIFPGQVLVIPSIKGETRDGTWDPNKTYQPLAK